MALSKSQLAANRANAQKSTGPITPEGKAASSRNSTRHGFCGRLIMLNPEDRQLYSELGKRYIEDLKPFGVLEEQLVRTLVDNEWQLNRIRARQEFVGLDFQADLTPEFQRLARYQYTLERSSYKATEELRKQQKVRIDAENYDDIIKFEDQVKKPYVPRAFGHLPRLHQLIGFVPQDNPTWCLYHRMAFEVLTSERSKTSPQPAPEPETDAAAETIA